MNITKTLVILSVLFASVTVSCSSEEEKQDTDSTSTENDSMVVEMKFAELVELDQKLVKTDMTIDGSVAQELYNKAKDFTANHPDYAKIEMAMEYSAKGAEGLGKKEEAVEILHKMYHQFANSEKAVVYMYNKARILESMPGKQANAKAAYEEMILKFPESQLSKDTKVYLDNYFGKSEEDIIKMLEEGIEQEVEKEMDAE